MQSSHVEELLRELAKYLDDGEIVRVSRRNASLSRWGKIKALGFRAVDYALRGMPTPLKGQRRY